MCSNNWKSSYVDSNFWMERSKLRMQGKNLKFFFSKIIFYRAHTLLSMCTPVHAPSLYKSIVYTVACPFRTMILNWLLQHASYCLLKVTGVAYATKKTFASVQLDSTRSVDFVIPISSYTKYLIFCTPRCFFPLLFIITSPNFRGSFQNLILSSIPSPLMLVCKSVFCLREQVFMLFFNMTGR